MIKNLRLLFEIFQGPTVSPGNLHLSCLLVGNERKPDITAVGKVFLLPHIETCDEESFLWIDWDDISALAVEGFVGIGACAWIANDSPFTHDVVGYSQFGTVGIPTRASAGEHVVLAVELEDGRRLTERTAWPTTS